MEEVFVEQPFVSLKDLYLNKSKSFLILFILLLRVSNHCWLSSGIKTVWVKIANDKTISQCVVPKTNISVILHSLGVEGEPGLVSAAAEDLQPLVEGGVLLLEEDDPFLEEAEAALLGGGVVSGGSGQDGPGEVVGDALVFQLPDVCTQPGPLLLPVLDVPVVAGDSLLGGVDAQPGVLLLLDDGQGRGVA